MKRHKKIIVYDYYMLLENSDHQKNVYDNIRHLSTINLIPSSHVKYLWEMRAKWNFEPKICYDVGSCVLHWTKIVEKVWTNTKCILFEAFEPASILYDPYDHYIGVLSNIDDKHVKFYQNDIMIGGNSYYRELAFNDGKFFPLKNYLVKKTRTLDSVVEQYKYSLPDLIKIDVQGAELDILKGGLKCLKSAKYLIIELQNKQYNEGAPLAEQTIEYLKTIGYILLDNFCINPSGADGDYCFFNSHYVE